MNNFHSLKQILCELLIQTKKNDVKNSDSILCCARKKNELPQLSIEFPVNIYNDFNGFQEYFIWFISYAFIARHKTRYIIHKYFGRFI